MMSGSWKITEKIFVDISVLVYVSYRFYLLKNTMNDFIQRNRNPVCTVINTFFIAGY